MKGKRLILLVVALLLLVGGSAVIGMEYYTGRPAFCGSCHIKKKPYDTWKKSKHSEKNVRCVDCHYAPGEKTTLKAKFKSLGQLFSYLATGDKEVRKKAWIHDESCTTSKCHPKDKFFEKEYKYTEKVTFVHKTHEEKTIEGQVPHCNTCHQHVTAGKHFEVPSEACYLCHFKNTKFNEGRSKCSLCHQIPEKPLQRQKEGKEKKEGENPITHKTLMDNGVACWSCHYELIKGKAEVKSEDCMDCHHSREILKAMDRPDRKKVMHREHVAGQNANCFDCHQPIVHKETEFLDPVRMNCQACHPDHHIYQKMLLVGPERPGVPATKSLMYEVKTNCLGCHIDIKTEKGEKLAHGTGKACVSCHKEKHDQMLDRWKNEIKEGLEAAKEMEREAEEALIDARGKVKKDLYDEAKRLLAEGRRNIEIVRFGNGVHNKKYSLMLLNAATINFEDLIDLLEEGGG